MRGYNGWALPIAEKERLLALCPPVYERVIAHHVTLNFNVDVSDDLPPMPESAFVLGIADDGAGVQTLVVEIDGTSKRPDGGVYHITWSLAVGRQPHESLQLAKDWPLRLGPNATPEAQTILFHPEPIRLEPAFFQHGTKY